MAVSPLWRGLKGARQNSSLVRWLPVAGAGAIMIIVAAVAIQSLSGLRKATASRRHTVDVILAAHSFQDIVVEIQRGLRSYVTTGDVNALASFETAVRLEPQQFRQLVELTRDDPKQQQRLKELGAAMQNVFSYGDRMIGIYKRQGTRAAVNADVTGTLNREAFGAASDSLKAFSTEEQRLLDMRDATEQSDYRGAERLLVGGSVLSVLLLVFASIMTSRQLGFRFRAEQNLGRALMLQKAILHSADYAIVTTDGDGIILTFNPAAERLLGYSANDVIGRETPVLWRDPQEIAERAATLSQKLGRIVRPTFEAIAMKVQADQIDEGEWTFIRKDGSRFIASIVVTALTDQTGNSTGFLGIFRDISARKSMEAEREKLILELKNALAEVKTLSGLIPICGWCKNVRNDAGYWQSVEHYVHAHTEATFTHGICPACREKFKAEIHHTDPEKPA
jgi:PAS domain S-box-containing protein